MRWVGAPGAFFLTRRIYLGLKYRRSDVNHYTYRGNLQIAVIALVVSSNRGESDEQISHGSPSSVAARPVRTSSLMYL
jgi:hypothetical protein